MEDIRKFVEEKYGAAIRNNSCCCGGSSSNRCCSSSGEKNRSHFAFDATAHTSRSKLNSVALAKVAPPSFRAA